MMASALLPSRKLTRSARTVRLITAAAAMGLVFMGAIVVPVYLVPALAVVLALGIAAESHPGWPAAVILISVRQRRRRVRSAPNLTSSSAISSNNY
jgi:hypothetical protein